MIRISQDNPISRLSEYFLGSTPDDGCSLLTGLMFGVIEVTLLLLLLLISYVSSRLLVVETFSYSSAVPVEVGFFQALPHQVAVLLIFAAIMYTCCKLGAFGMSALSKVCNRIKVV